VLHAAMGSLVHSAAVTITVREHSKDPKGTEHDQTMVYVR